MGRILHTCKGAAEAGGKNFHSGFLYRLNLKTPMQMTGKSHAFSNKIKYVRTVFSLAVLSIAAAGGAADASTRPLGEQTTWPAAVSASNGAAKPLGEQTTWPAAVSASNGAAKPLGEQTTWPAAVSASNGAAKPLGEQTTWPAAVSASNGAAKPLGEQTAWPAEAPPAPASSIDAPATGTPTLENGFTVAKAADASASSVYIPGSGTQTVENLFAVATPSDISSFTLMPASTLITAIAQPVPAAAEDSKADSNNNELGICINHHKDLISNTFNYCKNLQNPLNSECTTYLDKLYKRSLNNNQLEKAQQQLGYCQDNARRKKDLEGNPRARRKCGPKSEALFEAQKTGTKAAEAEEAWTKCIRRYEVVEGNSQCRQAADNLNDLKKELISSCGSLGGVNACIRKVRSCEKCDKEAGSSDLNCVLLRKKAFCPELSKDLLEDLDKESEKYTEKISSLEDKIKEQKEKKTRLEGELTEAKLEYEADIKKLKDSEEEAKEELERKLKELKGKIDGSLQTAIEKIQEEMGKARRIQYELSRSILSAHRKYRDGKREIYAGCQNESARRLSDYRKRRRSAIRRGKFRKESIYQMLSRNRVSFAEKDDARFLQYYNSCRQRSRYALQALKEGLKDNLESIEFQKQEIMRQYRTLQGQLASLSAKAHKSEQKAIKEYAERLQKIVAKHKAELDAQTRAYAQKGQNLNKQLMEATEEIIKLEGILQETQNKAGHNREMYHRLRSAGAPSEDKSADIAEAAGKISALSEEWQLAFDECACAEGEDFKNECRRIRSAGALIDPHHKNLRRSKEDEEEKDNGGDASAGTE